jgi:hypothetical protein
MIFLGLICMVITLGSVSAMDEILTNLESLRWKNRVILVYANEVSLAENAANNLAELAEGVTERDITWFVIQGEELSTNHAGNVDKGLREQLLETYFNPPPVSTAVILIGKDGGVKSRSSDLDLEATFDLIDQMPMRIQEMQQ